MSKRDTFYEVLDTLRHMQPCYEDGKYIGCKSQDCEYNVDGCYGPECAIEIVEGTSVYDFKELKWK